MFLNAAITQLITQARKCAKITNCPLSTTITLNHGLHHSRCPKFASIFCMQTGVHNYGNVGKLAEILPDNKFPIFCLEGFASWRDC